MIANIGLLVIALGWVCQVKSISKKKREISPVFIGAYIIGVGLLVIDGLLNQMMSLAILNFLTGLTAFGVLMKIKS